jgi:single-stranded-DNA-specific exonuclease
MYLERFGGHEMAAGMTVTAENFSLFSAAFIDMAKHKWENHRIEKRRVYDIECSVEYLMSPECLNFIRLLEPFGPGNLQPIFRDSHAKIVDARLVGRPGQHLQLTIRGKLANLKGIGFSLGNRIHEVQQESERVLVYTPTINRFRGNTSWQVRVLDV